jgi:hypothetical protein
VYLHTSAGTHEPFAVSRRENCRHPSRPGCCTHTATASSDS